MVCVVIALSFVAFVVLGPPFRKRHIYGPVKSPFGMESAPERHGPAGAPLTCGSSFSSRWRRVRALRWRHQGTGGRRKVRTQPKLHNRGNLQRKVHAYTPTEAETDNG